MCTKILAYGYKIHIRTYIILVMVIYNYVAIGIHHTDMHNICIAIMYVSTYNQDT